MRLILYMEVKNCDIQASRLYTDLSQFTNATATGAEAQMETRRKVCELVRESRRR